MNRPSFPKKILITAGMPYGSKDLHFGHIGGVFVQADIFARFMKDRIGDENVIFVSGTDCYGSPIVEKYRTLVENHEYNGSIIDFVTEKHNNQLHTLNDYLIGLSLFGASAIGESGKIHANFSREIFEQLYKSGYLYISSNKQFFDTEKNTFLNGRQVLGKCPIAGCKSEHAYADECSLGHQYFPEELLNPVSTLSGTTPVLREVKNWYLDTSRFLNFLSSLIENWRSNEQVRKLIITTCSDYLKAPMLFSKKDNLLTIQQLMDCNHINCDCEIDSSNGNTRVTFNTLSERERACVILASNNIRFRTGKTLVPFRISGNIAWGVKVPVKDEMNDLTFWVWPESLWAPISFTQTYLESIGKNKECWKDWWCADDSQVVQFIGEDNIYFYTLAEMSIFKALNFDGKWNIKMPTIVANKHLLFFDVKASSSGEIKPPMAQDLLNYYSAEQLRAHFFAMGLDNASVPFQPKPYNPVKTNQGDPVYKEWSIFTNFLNRAIRTLFYGFQKYNNGEQSIPTLDVSSEILSLCKNEALEYETLMHRFEFSKIMERLESFFKFINKYLSTNFSDLQKDFKQDNFEHLVVNGLHLIKTAVILSHPIAPASTEKVREYLGIDYYKLYSWEFIFDPISKLVPNDHKLKFLEPRIDFFSRPSWQY